MEKYWQALIRLSPPTRLIVRSSTNKFFGEGQIPMVYIGGGLGVEGEDVANDRWVAIADGMGWANILCCRSHPPGD